MNKWEYYTWNVASTAGLSERLLREELNSLGQKGWDLCSSSHNGILLFKRIKKMPRMLGSYGIAIED